MKKILVSLPDGVVEILDKEVVGKLGDGYSDSLRQIIMNWLSEHGYLANERKQEEQELIDFLKTLKKIEDEKKAYKNGKS
jgi:hypothetical protein